MERRNPTEAVGLQPLDQELRSGGERTRTADFYVANVALYQLSYTPEGPFRVPKHPSRLT